MLSNPSSNLHRRQDSTPNNFGATKVPQSTATTLQGYAPHRRGQSLDELQHLLQMRRQTSQDEQTVSTTNQGLQQNEQHFLREAQQHRLFRPGMPQLQHGHTIKQDARVTSNISDELSNYWQSLNSPFPDAGITAAAGQYMSKVPFSNTPILGTQRRSDNAASAAQFDPAATPNYFDDCFGLGLDLALDKNLFTEGAFEGGSLPSLSYDPTHAFTAGSYIQGSGSCTQTASGLESARPSTPVDKIVTNMLPATPAATPCGRQDRMTANHGLILSGLQTAGNGQETIRAPRSRGLQQRPIAGTRYHGDGRAYGVEGLPSPPHTSPLKPSNTFDLAPMPNRDYMKRSNTHLDVADSDATGDSSYYSPLSSVLSPSMSSLQSSPELAHLVISESTSNSFHDNPMSTRNPNLPVLAHGLPFYQRSNVDVESPRFSDIADGKTAPRPGLYIDASVEDTGITIEDIASFIEGPNPEDGKWQCLYPDCNKRFGRKENIKSHVQTHLGDRQYRCNHCKKCFVRQHDLKRHAKIHSGVKPYPCLCGNSFARHDALTRHRQRGMCIGAFEGVVKKPVKRGRPRKNRPDTEERQDKAARTRKKVMARSYAASVSTSSDSSNEQSPLGFFGSSTSPDSSPFEPPQESSSMPYGLQADVVAFTPPTSPGSLLQGYLSRVNDQRASHVSGPGGANFTSNNPLTESSPEETAGFGLEASSPMKSVSSQYGTPPELCLSSSPPPSTFFDFDRALNSLSGQTQHDNKGSVDKTNPLTDLAMSDISEDVDQLFFDPFDSESGVNGLSNPSMFLGKFDSDPFGEGPIFQTLSDDGCDDFFATP